jgi:hypothetical protein
MYRMIGPFGDWLVHRFALWGIPLQNWMIPFVSGAALCCLVLWHLNRRR